MQKFVVFANFVIFSGEVVAAAAPSGSKPNLKAVQAPLIMDWQLPLRYRRQPMSQQEVDYINVIFT